MFHRRLEHDRCHDRLWVRHRPCLCQGLQPDSVRRYRAVPLGKGDRLSQDVSSIFLCQGNQADRTYRTNATAPMNASIPINSTAYNHTNGTFCVTEVMSDLSGWLGSNLTNSYIDTLALGGNTTAIQIIEKIPKTAICNDCVFAAIDLVQAEYPKLAMANVSMNFTLDGYLNATCPAFNATTSESSRQAPPDGAYPFSRWLSPKHRRRGGPQLDVPSQRHFWQRYLHAKLRCGPRSHLQPQQLQKHRRLSYDYGRQRHLYALRSDERDEKVVRTLVISSSQCEFCTKTDYKFRSSIDLTCVM